MTSKGWTCRDCDFYIIREWSTGMAAFGDLRYYHENYCKQHKEKILLLNTKACKDFDNSDGVSDWIDSVSNPNNYDLGA